MNAEIWRTLGAGALRSIDLGGAGSKAANGPVRHEALHITDGGSGAPGQVEGAGEEVVIDDAELKDFVGQPPFSSDRIYDRTPAGVVMGLAWRAPARPQRAAATAEHGDVAAICAVSL